MINKTAQVSMDGGQAGEAIYKLFPIASDKTNLPGFGMYFQTSDDVAYWCEYDGESIIYYENKSVEPLNYEVTFSIFVEYCRNKIGRGLVEKVLSVDTSNL